MLEHHTRKWETLLLGTMAYFGTGRLTGKGAMIERGAARYGTG